MNGSIEKTYLRAMWAWGFVSFGFVIFFVRLFNLLTLWIMARDILLLWCSSSVPLSCLFSGGIRNITEGAASGIRGLKTRDYSNDDYYVDYETEKHSYSWWHYYNYKVNSVFVFVIGDVQKTKWTTCNTFLTIFSKYYPEMLHVFHNVLLAGPFA